MGKTVFARDFQEGGVFHKLTLPKFLPIPKEILKYIYDDQCPTYVDCGMFCLDPKVELNLLKRMWKLKGIAMFNCGCIGDDHIITLEESIEMKCKPCVELYHKQFHKNGIFADLEITPHLPLNPKIIEHFYGKLSIYDQIPEGKCFKCDTWQMVLLQVCYSLKHGIRGEICHCFKHLNFTDQCCNENKTC